MEYHKTQQIFHVMNALGHKSVLNTQIYVHINEALFANHPPDQYFINVANTQEAITKLLEIGYEYIFTKDDLAYFRKRK